MKKTDYLLSVSPFIDYLADVWNSGFSHAYPIKLSQWIKHNGTTQWSCSSLSDAKKKYWWHGDYAKAEARLDLFGRGWHRATTQNNNNRAKGVVQCIFRWGGVLYQGENRASVSTHPDFIRCMNDAKDQLLSGDDSVPDFDKSRSYKMNSAYTKAYAVMDDRLIIYDGRVGAALGLLAKSYFTASATTLPSVDFSLVQFPWGSERKSGQRYVSAALSERNPSSGSYSFPQLRNDSRQHAIWAVRASWLVGELVLRIRERTDDTVTGRDIESALFMIGYRVR